MIWNIKRMVSQPGCLMPVITLRHSTEQLAPGRSGESLGEEKAELLPGVLQSRAGVGPQQSTPCLAFPLAMCSLVPQYIYTQDLSSMKVRQSLACRTRGTLSTTNSGKKVLFWDLNALKTLFSLQCDSSVILCCSCTACCDLPSLILPFVSSLSVLSLSYLSLFFFFFPSVSYEFEPR